MTNFAVVHSDARTTTTQIVGTNPADIMRRALELAQSNADAIRLFVSIPGAAKGTFLEYSIDRRQNGVQLREVTGLRLARS